MSFPEIRTERLFLRGFTAADAPRIQALAGEREVASGTLTIPHPYEDGMAEIWIAGQAEAWDAKQMFTLAMTTGADGLVGAVGLRLVPEHRRAELGYWIGVPYWNRGYATEASAGVLEYGFTELSLNRIVARHYQRNPASGRVLEKLGMRHEGTQRQHVVRWDQLEDLECYAILESEWRGQAAERPDPESPV